MCQQKRMSCKPKRRFAFKRRAGTEKARPLSVSIYPRHLELLKKREQEFNVSRSTIIGLLLDLETRDGLLRQELVRLSRAPNWTPQVESRA
jgi:hypothetical protein